MRSETVQPERFIGYVELTQADMLATHESGVQVVLATIADMYGAFSCLGLYGTNGSMNVKSVDTFYSFRAPLTAFVEYLKSGKLPFEFSQTVELMKIIIAGIRSRNENGRTARVAMGGCPPMAPTEPNVHVDAFGSSVFSIRYVR